MSATALASPAWLALSPAYLETFATFPGNGTLVAPCLDGRADVGKMAILDERSAQDLESSTALVLEEVGRYWTETPEELRRNTNPLPGLAGWNLTCYTPGRMTFSRGVHHLDIETRQGSRWSYSVQSKTVFAEIALRISIDRTTHQVFTDDYSFRARFSNFQRAAEFAWMTAALVYQSGQYNVGRELGPMRFRPNETSVEMEIHSSRPPAVPWSLFRPREEVLFASAHTVFDSPSFREPVMSASVFPAEGGHDVCLSLYRPPSRRTPRMGLVPRLRKTLWAPLQNKIGK